MALRDDMKSIATEAASETDTRLDFFLALAEDHVNRNFFSAKADRAVVFMALHLLTLANRAGTAGAITSERVGDVAASYAAPAGGSQDESLKQTAYGSMFISLRNSIIRTPLVV